MGDLNICTAPSLEAPLARALSNPQSPFASTVVEWEGPAPSVRLEVLPDNTRSILSKNTSPDLHFEWAVNPYRGCTHACAYCYARRFHEYLGLGAGTDFETRVLVKHKAPELLEEAFLRPSWSGQLLAFSGVTDCYQPLERRFSLTRRCLEVCARYRNPVSLITRSGLITRDIDVLERIAAESALRVSLSVPILDKALCQALEPGAPLPHTRLKAIRALTEAGIQVGVSLAPVIPGLNDRAIPQVLQAAREAGATHAWVGLVRLAGNVAQVFEARCREALGDTRTEAVLARIRRARGGSLSALGWDDRMSGVDASWRATRQLFDVWHRRLGFEPWPALPSPSPFRRPGHGRQLGLFASR